MKSEDYYFTLDNLMFSRDHLVNLVKNDIDAEDWYIFDCGKLRWTVFEEYSTDRSECTRFTRTPWFEELISLFNPPIHYSDIFFTRTPPPGIPPHIDRNRPAAINFPVTGTFDNSPMVWFKDFDRETLCEEYHHSYKSPVTNDLSAVLFNPQKIHGVLNENDTDRCLLSVWWRDHSFEEIKKLWSEGELINWDINRTNKYVKFVK
jgi:hypothetical protein